MTSLWNCKSVLVLATITVVAFISTVFCQTQCGNAALKATGNAQILTSPNYPSNYSSNANCVLAIRAASNSEVVVLKLLDFDLEGPSPSCNYDYVTIYDGSSTRIQQLCGQVAPTQIISTISYMTVVFHSDSSINYRGFKFEYTSLNKSALCQNFTKFSDGTSQYVTSPGYPYGYTSDVDCSWVVSADSPSQVVVLNLLDFYLEGYYPSCYNDHVSLYDGNTTNSTLIRKLCGQVSKTEIAASGMYMTVVFHSDASGSFKGFKFDTSSQNRSAWCHNGTLSATGNPNYLMSPNYPNNYTSDANCKWDITAASSSEVVVLKFLDFDLDGSGAPCPADVTIYDGLTPKMQLCGQTSTTQFISTGERMSVWFRLKSMINYKGIKLEYISVNKSALCDNFTKFSDGTSQYVTSPGYPYGYTSELDCSWVVSADSPSQVVVLNWLDFYLQGYSPFCLFDYVAIYDGNTTNSPLIRKLCDQVSNTQIAASGMYMTVVFHSDSDMNYKGFKFQTSSQNRSAFCSNGTLVANGNPNYLLSHNYPNNYTSNANCNLAIRAASNSEVVLLKLLDFDLEGPSPSCASDHVTIYDGSSTRIQQLCGQVAPRQFISTFSYVTVVFHSNSNNNYRGFKIEYTSLNKSALCQNFTKFSNGTSQYVTSPGYPYGYTSELDCSSVLSADSPFQVVVLNMLDFYLEGYYPSCVYDYVAIYDGNTTNSPLIRKLCGQVSNTQIAASGMYMTVLFHSDSYTNSRGFKLETLSQNRSSVFCQNDTLSATEKPSTLMSPNYPNYYASNTNCQWTIQAASSSEIVVLKVLTCELEFSASCISDYVAVYDGSSTSSPLYKRLCGKASSQPFISSGSSLTVVFHSDQMINFSGFKLEYTSQTKTGVCNNFTTLSYNNTNYFMSPGYPYSYLSNLDCSWRITSGSSSSVVVANLIYLSLGSTSACSTDYVVFYDGNSTSSPLLMRMCGKVPTAQIKSSGEYLYVFFRSGGITDSAGYTSGFAFSYTSQIKPAQCADVRLSGDVYDQYFTSANYPNRYPSNMDCKWFIKADSASKVVELTLSGFSLGGSQPQCFSDYVKIYDGPSTSSNLIKTLCGSQYGGTYKSTGSDMTVIFHSDDLSSYYHSGFKFSYKSKDPVVSSSAQCADVRLSGDVYDQYFTSANYPNRYPRNMDCKWFIKADSASKVVEFTVSDFSLGGIQPQCISDYVKIYDGSSTSSTLIKTLCGSQYYGTYKSTGSDMTVVFHSDGLSGYYDTGFKFSYKSKDPVGSSSAQCADVRLSADVYDKNLTSANYPSPYPSNMDCKWFIKADSASKVVELTLSGFSLGGSQPQCISDYVKIYDGPSTSSSLIKTLCGSLYLATYKSTGADMTVVFHSDVNYYNSGFKFYYKSKDPVVSSSAQCADVRLSADVYDQYFTSANYPSPYPSNMDCTWFIKANSVSRLVELELKTFSLGGSQPCTSDYIKIYDGPSTSSTLIKTLCGSQYYGTYKSTGSDMTVVFHSDDVSYYYNTGFKFSYTTNDRVVSSSDYSYTSSSNRVPGIAAAGAILLIVSFISTICFRRRRLHRQLRATQAVGAAQNTTGNQNVGEASVFFLAVVSNNSEEASSAPPGTQGTQQTTQAPFQPPQYSNLNCDMNAHLPNYDPRYPNYSRAMNPPPLYSEVVGGAAPYGQKPPSYDPKPEDCRLEPLGGTHGNVAPSSHAITWAPANSDSYSGASPVAPDCCINN